VRKIKELLVCLAPTHSSAEIQTVELYCYSHSLPSRHVIGVILYVLLLKLSRAQLNTVTRFSTESPQVCVRVMKSTL